MPVTAARSKTAVIVIRGKGYPGGQTGTDVAVLGGDPRTTVGSGCEAAAFVGSTGGTETTSADGTEMISANAQTNARAPSRERRVLEGRMAEI